VFQVVIDDVVHDVEVKERLVDLTNRVGVTIPRVCYHEQLGPIQTCDTCMVEVNGELVRACATEAADGMCGGSWAASSRSGSKAFSKPFPKALRLPLPSGTSRSASLVCYGG
jgi:formate dehydrogenase major subunit